VVLLLLTIASGNFEPVNLPSIIITGDGSIDPADVPINRTGNVYTLIGNISDYSLNVQCNNITVDGAGYTLQTKKVSQNHGISIEANGVTVKNIRIDGYYSVGINIGGSFNTITKNSIPTDIGTGINLQGDYNNITRNTLDNSGSGIDIAGKYNNIIGNVIRKRGHGIWIDVDFAYFNNIVGNNISSGGTAIVLNAISMYSGIALSGYNAFYLNNFESVYSQPVSLIGGANHSAKYAVNIFDNRSVGNYWSDYSGKDANHDGIGDTPYVIGENITDRYPLMAPFDIDNNPIVVVPLPIPSPAEPFPTTLAVASAVTVTAIIAVGLLVYVRKRKRF